jgi:predicted SprT family Zn-dependent metalloprotease
MSLSPSQKEFNKVLATLRALVPPAHPVEVRRVKMADDWGYCILVAKPKKKFKIRVNKANGNEFSIWVLMHEWAHALAWTMEHQRVDDHGPEFGIAYARVWKAYYGE